MKYGKPNKTKVHRVVMRSIDRKEILKEKYLATRHGGHLVVEVFTGTKISLSSFQVKKKIIYITVA
jgi:hypothetical protein